ncbi:MAG: hypothetical protein M0C28_38740 [Candidatus Moduliflexus flocculans]|nr:hypothetical protein [Candidatus Moduliflexus flocculans]
MAVAGRRSRPPGQRVRPVPAEDAGSPRARGPDRSSSPSPLRRRRPDARLRRLERDPAADGRSRDPTARESRARVERLTVVAASDLHLGAAGRSDAGSRRWSGG